MKIYFDNVLIDEDAYADLENTYKLFTDNFYLGSTASNTFKITIAKTAVSSHPSEVKITDDTNTYYLIVDKVTEEKNFYIYELVDKLVLFNFNYDASVLINERAEDELTTTLTDILTDMCSKVGIEIDENLTLINDITITWYDNTLLARDYLGFIAELQGGFVRILNNGKLSIVGHNMSPQATLNTGDVEEFIKSEEKTISKVVFDNGLVNWEVGDDTGNTLYLNPNNVYIVNEDIIGNIFNRVNGLNFWIGSITKCTLPNNIRAGDIITILDGVTPYNIIVGYTSSYTDVNQIAMITNDVQTKQQETTQIIGINSKIFSIKTIIDRTNASVQTIAERVDDTETSISSITQDIEGIDVEVAKINPLQTKTAQLEIDVNQLRSEIGDVTDITTQEEGAGTLLFESINTSEPINITIRPTAEKDISYLYPSSRLFPSSSLFPQNRILRFYNSTEDETIDYLIPGNLRYLSPTVYDEFFLDFATATCKITRKVAIAEDMTKSALAIPVEEEYDYPSIPLSAGNYTVTMLGYPSAYMKIRLMSQNMYTSQFATRVELSSAITQSANAINLEVAKKVDETEVIASINLTSETATINASKINIAGVITAMNNDTTTTIDGDKITTGSITASQVSSGIITTSNLSAQNISATQITTGTLTGRAISGGSINIGSGKFTVDGAGTLSATGATIEGTINATSGTFANLSGGGLTLNSSGAFKYYDDPGFLYCGGNTTVHPYVSALNVSSAYYNSATNNSRGISFRSGTYRNDAEEEIGFINTGLNGSGMFITNRLGTMNIRSETATGITAGTYLVTNSGTYTQINSGTYIQVKAGTPHASQLGTNSGSVYIASNNDITSHINLKAGGYVYVASYAGDNSYTGYKVKTTAGDYSSKNIKKNIKRFKKEEYEKAVDLLKKLNIYNYKYKYKGMYKRKEQYGFIIDEIEQLDNKFFDFNEEIGRIENNGLDFSDITKKGKKITVKNYNPDVLDKYLLTVCKAQQMKIDKLEKRIEKLEGKNGKTN